MSNSHKEDDVFGKAPDISHNEVTLGKKLGEGQFGAVYEAKCRGVTVAVKVLHATDMSAEDIEDFKNEVGIMVHLRNPNIVLLMAACFDVGKFMIVTELMKTDFGNLIHNPEYNLTLPTKLKLAKDVANGLSWLHLSKPPILHRDIKPTNILVDAAMNAKLCDFGLSCIRKKKHIQDDGDAPGSPLWMSPEVLLGKKVNEKADVYAYAIVLWELFTGQDPFSEYDELEPFINAICHRGERPPIPPDMNALLKDIITKSWDADPEVRPSCSDLIPRFDEVLLDISIHDTVGKQMWKTNFDGKREVSFKNFDSIFYRAIGEDYPPYPEFDDKHKCLKAILSSEKDDQSSVVSVDNFGLFVDWFGPCDKGILTRLLNAMKEDWFHGDITREESELKLSDFDRKGTFMVRLSTNAPKQNPFTLSMINKKGDLVHLRIKRTKEGKLKLFLKKHGKAIKIEEPGGIENLVNVAKTTLGLSKPCLGRKYKDIFKKKKGVYMMNDYSSSNDDE
jgi:serine/threonine protein kinase